MRFEVASVSEGPSVTNMISTKTTQHHREAVGHLLDLPRNWQQIESFQVQ